MLIKNHDKYQGRWYDGWIYSKLIDSIKKTSLDELIFRFVGEQKKIIDIGCGTGALDLKIAPKCKGVLGLDISPKMINFANNEGKIRFS